MGIILKTQKLKDEGANGRQTYGKSLSTSVIVAISTSSVTLIYFKKTMEEY